jgi:hypothetical protein
MSTTTAEAGTVATFKAKKSVALSRVTAGNTALCTVGKASNDLHYHLPAGRHQQGCVLLPAGRA